ncbi:hypothetical protein U9M48_002987, partial [Paspalum notatum var. saurae]
AQLQQTVMIQFIVKLKTKKRAKASGHSDQLRPLPRRGCPMRRSAPRGAQRCSHNTVILDTLCILRCGYSKVVEGGEAYCMVRVPFPPFCSCPPPPRHPRVLSPARRLRCRACLARFRLATGGEGDRGGGTTRTSAGEAVSAAGDAPLWPCQAAAKPAYGTERAGSAPAACLWPWEPLPSPDAEQPAQPCAAAVHYCPVHGTRPCHGLSASLGASAVCAQDGLVYSTTIYPCSTSSRSSYFRCFCWFAFPLPLYQICVATSYQFYDGCFYCIWPSAALISPYLLLRSVRAIILNAEVRRLPPNGSPWMQKMTTCSLRLHLQWSSVKWLSHFYHNFVCIGLYKTIHLNSTYHILCVYQVTCQSNELSLMVVVVQTSKYLLTLAKVEDRWGYDKRDLLTLKVHWFQQRVPIKLTYGVYQVSPWR